MRDELIAALELSRWDDAGLFMASWALINGAERTDAAAHFGRLVGDGGFLDAARRLIPDAWPWSVGASGPRHWASVQHERAEDPEMAEAATPGTALLLALLRAIKTAPQP